MSDNKPLALEHCSTKQGRNQTTENVTDAAIEATNDDIEEKNDDKAGGEPFVDRDTTQLDEELNVSNSSFSMLGGSVLDSLDPLGTHENEIEVAHTHNLSWFWGKSLTL